MVASSSLSHSLRPTISWARVGWSCRVSSISRPRWRAGGTVGWRRIRARVSRPVAAEAGRPGAGLLGCLPCGNGQRLGAGPGMFGDVEQDALGAVHLDLEAAGPLGLGLVHVMPAAARGDVSAGLLDVVDQDAEMVQPGEIHATADLIGLEAQDRQIDRAVADVMTIGQR